MADADDDRGKSATTALGLMPEGPGFGATGRWILLVTIFGSALVIIDVTAMNVVVPSIQKDLDTTVAGVQWVVEAYTLFLASVTLVGGALGDRYGRRKVYGIGIALFAAASLACGLAPTMAWLVAARAAQGLGGALMLPGALALLGAHFDRERRNRAIGIWASMSGLTAVLGPVLGGILSDVGSWRWIFFLNVPVGALLLVPLVKKVPESTRGRKTTTLDILGAALATLGLAAITFGLIEAGVSGWNDPLVIAAFVAGVLLIALFILREARAPDPMLDLGLFGDRDFAGANGLTLFVYAALAAGMFMVPMRLIFLEGYSPTRAGFAMVPVILLISLLSPRFGALTDRIGARTLLTAGATITASGFVVMAVPDIGVSYWLGTFWGLALVGLGMAFIVAPLTNTVLSSVPEDAVGVASGVNNAVSRLGALLAIAVAGLVGIAAFGHWLAPELDDIGLEPGERDEAWRRRVDLAAAEPPDGLDADEAAALEAAYDKAFLWGYRAVQVSMGASALLGGMIGALSLRGRKEPAG